MFRVGKHYDVYLCETRPDGHSEVCNFNWVVAEVGMPNVRFRSGKEEIILNASSPLFVRAVLKD
jgi:hypothetical protein